MRLFQRIFFLFFVVLLPFSSCKSNKKNQQEATKKTILKYAKGFDIQQFKTHKKLIILSPYKGSKEKKEYLVFNKKTNAIIDYKQPVIEVPLKRMVATSTTHIPMIELLKMEKTIVGFPFANYISSEKTRKLVDHGNIKEIGKENALNTEILLDLQPELIVGYGVSSTDKSLNIVEKAGIPVIYNGDWLEETPLGRSEWIKFFGVLFNESKKADSIFNSIEAEYQKAIEIASKVKQQPTVFSGAIMSKDIWNLPAGESFVATFLKDANLNYLWKNTKGKGSLSLSFESVFDKAQQADFWISPGYFSSKEQLLKSNKLYEKFKAFKNDQIYTPMAKTGKTGGILYFELAPTRPDLVLKDLIKITNPSFLTNYELTFFEKLK